MSELIDPSSTGEDAPVEGAEDLQFDQAEYAAPPDEGPACSVCHQPIIEDYYEINQRVICPNCRQGVEAAFRGGSPIVRLIKATVLGSLAALVGAIIYYAFIRLTEINFALVAILVGFLVGKAVRMGTGNRGGLSYQFLALFLTYSSIAAMHLPLLIEELVNEEQGKAAVQVAEGNVNPAAKADADPAKGEDKDPTPIAEDKDPTPIAEDKDPTPIAEDKPDPNAPPLSMGRFVLLALIITYSLPVAMAIGSPISGLIYAFGLWEAWRLNKGIRLEFNGPYRLAAAGDMDVVEEVADGT